MSIEASEYTADEIQAALSPTLEEVEEMENTPPIPPQMGKYGNLFWDFIQEKYPSRVTYWQMEAKMRDLCIQVNEEAKEAMWTMQEQLRQKNPLQAMDMTLEQYNTWVRDTAEEIVLNEIVYKYR